MLSLNNIHQYAIMLHWCLTGQTMTAGDIRIMLRGGTALPTPRLTEGVDAAWTPTAPACSKSRCSSVCGEGRIDANPFGERAVSHAERDVYRLGDPLRENKDTVIIFAALCARAAIEGRAIAPHGQGAGDHLCADHRTVHPHDRPHHAEQ